VRTDHDVDAIAESIKVNGFRDPIELWATEDGKPLPEPHTIVAGEGRYLAARRLVLQDVPCIEFDFDSLASAKRYAIANNRLTDKSAFDDAALLAQLEELPTLEGTGFTLEDLEELGDDSPVDLPGDPEDVPDVQEDAITKLGDVWLCGDHRVMCGDSADAADAAVLGGAGAHTLVFDPPWDAGVQMPNHQTTLCFGDGSTLGRMVALFGEPVWVFVWDCVSSWFTPNRPLRRLKLCLWFGDLDLYNSEGAHYGEHDGGPREVSNTRGTYKFTPCIHGKHLSDVFQLPITQFHAAAPHPHSKPIDWVRMLLGNCSGGDVLDPFLGSGTTLVAAEQLGRVSYCMEIDPLYVDVSVRRWQKATGKAAILESTGGCFGDSELNAAQ
jgi:hypothetical protein